MSLRRLAIVAFGAWVGLLEPRGAHARAAPPDEAALRAAAGEAALALGSYEKGEWEQTAQHGQAALAVLGPAFGWDEKKVIAPVLLVTVDALRKLGRNEEADALAAKYRAAAGRSQPAQPSPDSKAAPATSPPSGRAPGASPRTRCAA